MLIMNIEKIVIISIYQKKKRKRKKIPMIVMKNQMKKRSQKIPKLKKILIMKIVEIMTMIYQRKIQKTQI